MHITGEYYGKFGKDPETSDRLLSQFQDDDEIGQILDTLRLPE